MSLTWRAADGTTLLFGRESGVSIQRGASGLDGPPNSHTLQPRVNTDGSVLVHTQRATRPIFLPLHVDETIVSYNDVIELFYAGGTLISERDGIVRELRHVIYDSGLEGEWSGDTGGVTGLTFRKYPLSLIALDPWWYGTAVTVDTLADADDVLFNADIPFNADVPFNGGSSATITVVGNTYASPRIVLIAGGDPLGTGTVTDGNRQWTTTVGVLPDSALEVDSRPGSRGPHYGSDLVVGAAATPVNWSYLTEESEPFDLPIGTTTVSYAFDDAGPAATIRLWYEPRWFTP